ncbi:hypothetical protein SLE2022_340200 [Rubroshorea leprosula]
MSSSLLLVSIPFPAANGGLILDNHRKIQSLNYQNGRSKDSLGIRSRDCKLKPKSNSRRLCCNSLLADFAPTASAAYGVLLLSGGVFAFSRSGSKGSLFGGFTGAALMASAYFLMQSSDKKALGDAIGFGSAFLFSSVFGIRLAATRKLIPSGLLLGLSICALAVFVSAYLQDSV